MNSYQINETHGYGYSCQVSLYSFSCHRFVTAQAETPDWFSIICRGWHLHSITFCIVLKTMQPLGAKEVGGAQAMGHKCRPHADAKYCALPQYDGTACCAPISAWPQYRIIPVLDSFNFEAKVYPNPLPPAPSRLSVRNLAEQTLIKNQRLAVRQTWSRFLRRFRSDLTRSLLKERVRPDLKVLRTGSWIASINSCWSWRSSHTRANQFFV